MKTVYKTIKNSILSKEDLDIYIPFIDNSESSLYKRYKQFSTGITVKSKKKYIYSVCSGVVVSVDKLNKKKHIVTVQFDIGNCIRYSGLSSIDVKQGKMIKKGDLIGKYDTYLLFSHLSKSTPSTNKGQQIFACPIYDLMYYYIDPQPLASGQLDLDKSIIKEQSEVNPMLGTDWSDY